MAALLKLQRQRRIAQILRQRAVESQAELARLLRERGERVTQATLSRDLEELGAFKARLPNGQTAYRLPEEPPDAKGDWLRRMLAEFAIDIEASGNLVVVKTPPGGAQAVARAIDGSTLEGVLGTVAGDDTILVVSREGVAGETVARRLRRLAGDARLKREA
jgi:transcriptional regulator of arginine metabolism